MMKIFDSHCHLDDRAFAGDLEDVYRRARDAGVVGQMIVGTTLASSQRAVELAARFEGVFASVGVHPHDAAGCSTAVLDALQRLAAHPKVRAWGETGLDFNRMYSPRADQERWFARQLEIADGLELPLIFHERDSGGRLLAMLEESRARARAGVVHCFSGDRPELQRYLNMGFFIGVTGILTIRERGRALRQLVVDIPADRLVIETDAPYLIPAPEKNKARRNEPAFVRSVLLRLAEVRGEDPEQLAATLWKNTCRLYRLDPQAAATSA